MPKTYREYCLEALKKNPALYKDLLLPDGELKPFPSFVGFGKGVVLEKISLRSLPRNGLVFKPKPKQKPSVKITGTQLVMFGKNIDMTILPLPSKSGLRAYNRVWMHNYRVRRRIKILKEKYKITIKL